MRSLGIYALLLFVPAASFAQSFVLRAVTVDGGGVRQASTGYSCAGLSIGQQVASGVATSGQYHATLGIWHCPPWYTGVLEKVGPMASALVFGLSSVAPNPFGRQTAIRYSLPNECEVALRVYNSTGRAVATFVRGRQTAGRYTLTWDVSGVPAARLPSGTYFCRLEAGDNTATRKTVLQR